MKAYLHLADTGLSLNDISLRIYQGVSPVSLGGLALSLTPLASNIDYVVDGLPAVGSQGLTLTLETPPGVYHAYRFGVADTQPVQVIIPVRQILASPVTDLSLMLFKDGIMSTPTSDDVIRLSSDGEYSVSGWISTPLNEQWALRWIYNGQVFIHQWTGESVSSTGTFYEEIIALQSPFTYGVDLQNRVIFSCNFLVHALSPVLKLEDDIEQMMRTGAVLGSDEILYTGPRAVIPDGDGPFILLVSTGGHQSDETHDTKRDNPSFQIITRATDYNLARDRALSIYQYLDGLRSVQITRS